MKTNEVIQVALFFGLLIGLTPIIGRFMARVFQGQRTFLHPLLRPVERLVYWAGGVDEQAEMTWKGYFLAVLVFNVVGILSLMGAADDPEVAAAQSATSGQRPVGARR